MTILPVILVIRMVMPPHVPARLYPAPIQYERFETERQCEISANQFRLDFGAAAKVTCEVDT